LQIAKSVLAALGLGLALSLTIQAQDEGAYAPPAPADNGVAAQGYDQGQSQPTSDPSQAPGAPDGQDSGATFQTFYDSLASQGSWIETNDYGYVWQPQENDPNWAPYTDGHWVYTDDGWTWASDESFGWATYHYGRWVNIDGTGWVWVPGYTWAPAWVSWRYGDGYVGWAPLPPDSFAGIDYFGDGFDADFGFHIGGDCDDFYGIGPALYIFLPINCVCYHDYHHWYYDRHDNFNRINHTTNVTNINVTRGGATGAGFAGSTFRHVTTGGPKVAQVDAASQSPVPRVNVVRSSTPGGGTLNGNTLALYAPHVGPSAVNARPARIATAIGAAQINRGTDIMRPPTVNARLAPVAATQEQIDAARLAQGHAPENAKVLTDASNVKPIFQGPLTTMKPAPQAVAVTPRTYNYAPASIYGNNAGAHPVYAPTTHVPTAATSGETPSERDAREAQQSAPSRIYNPAPTYTPHYNSGSGNEAPSESRTYAHPAPSYSAPPAPASRAPSAPAGGGYGGGGYSGGSRGGAGGGYGNGGGNGGSSGSGRTH
jgi:hypothetical protein